jgi:predicted PurR-regulated permease PerM
MAVLIFAFYMLLSRNRLEDQIGIFFGETKKKELGRFISTLETRLGGWARGQLTLMFAVGLATYIGLLILGIPYALPLAILAGLLEIIPILGPIISAVPGAIIGFGISPLTGVGVIAMAFLIQQLENYLLIPKIMEKSVGVSPIITLVAISIGARLAGIVGVIISVPMVITLQVFVKEYLVKE